MRIDQNVLFMTVSNDKQGLNRVCIIHSKLCYTYVHIHTCRINECCSQWCRLLLQPEGSRTRSNVTLPSEKTFCIQMLTTYYIIVFPVDVFRGRGRYVDEDFDLDLTYITERIIGECSVCVCVCVE